MANHPPQAPSPSFELGDFYYTIFRHKWKILLCSLAGIAAALAYRKFSPYPYQSEAKLFVRYVITEDRSLGPAGDDSVIKSPDQRGETIMKSEAEILTSLDLAQEVAAEVGPAKILASTGGAQSQDAAAVMIQKNLTVEVAPYSSVIRIVFTHPDAAVVQVVLRDLIDSYKKKHSDIHRPGGMVDDSLTQETDQLRASLNQTEEDLRSTLNQANIVSLDDFKRINIEQRADLRRAIFDLQAELAQRTSLFQGMTKGTIHAPPSGLPPDSKLSPPSSDEVEAYQKNSDSLAQLHQRERDLLAQFTEGSTRVKEVRSEIAKAEDQKKRLEASNPSLVKSISAQSLNNQGQPAPEYNPVTEAVEINSLQAKLATLQSQLNGLQTEAEKVNGMEIQIKQLSRQKDLLEKNYLLLAQSLEQSRINESLGSGRISNIGDVESPTPPLRDPSKTVKTMFGIAAGGIAAGFAWAFLIELFLDSSVRKAADVEKVLHLPLFLSLPKIKAHGLSSKLLANEARTLPSLRTEEPSSANAVAATAPSESDLSLRPFYETLRDRLFSYFDSINIQHKPKLVAVTGVGTESGVTTVAAGLARSISETGEGNVLLVDMTQGQGSAQHFHKGKSVGLEELFDAQKAALVQDNLYVVGESSSSERLAKGMPQRFNQLVPKLKASDFDYIIFDMPPVNQISITPRLAKFMDMVLLVIESEKTDRDIAKSAAALLARSNSNLGVVLNKTKSYIPSSLHQNHDFLLGT